jgi:hypothetical protein
MTSYRYAVTAKARETNDNRVNACTILAIASTDEERECMTRENLASYLWHSYVREMARITTPGDCDLEAMTHRHL